MKGSTLTVENKNMTDKTTIPVLYRHHSTGYFEPMECVYKGDIPRKVWKRLNTQFLKLDAAQYFYPAEPLDAYHEAIAALEATAAKIAAGEIVLTTSSLETYLTGVIFRALSHFRSRTVKPMREEYRRVEPELDAEDETMTARELAEALPGEPNAKTRRDEAAFILAEICAKLPMEVVLAFRAYVAAEGNLIEAAHLAKVPKATFYRKWPGYLKLALELAIKEG